MSPPRVLLDPAVPLFALGSPSDLRAPCQRVLWLVSEGEIEAFGSVELIQEVAFHHLRRTQDRHAAAAAARDVMSLVRILDFDRAVLEEALRLIEAGSVRGRDAIHAATALAHSLDTIVTPDSDFDGIPGLRRLDPQDAARQWGSSL